jgi:hypothetical protein
VPGVRIGLDEALDLTRTGDVWLFRGHTAADRAIQLTTNSPVNHVGNVDRPGNPRGCETWEDAGSWWHSGSIRRSCVNAR